MAKKLSDDNPCKGCGARRNARCICIPNKPVGKRLPPKENVAAHCGRRADCILLDRHSRPDCFTHADDAELARFHSKEVDKWKELYWVEEKGWQ